MRDKKIYIRADGNNIVGTGHVMRCLSIAEQLLKFTKDITFITADESMSLVIKETGYQTISLNTYWDHLDAEIEQICKVIDDNNPHAILVDSYFVTETYLSELRKHTKVFYIDDLYSFEYPVDVIINYNIYGLQTKYVTEKYKNLYLGPQYAPLRSEFFGQPIREFEGLRRILISSGGTDEYNVVRNILDTLTRVDELKNVEYYCILGRYNKHKEELERVYNQDKSIHFLMNVNNMSKYMRRADIAITAGGSTCYELCACGLPSIIYTLADNQLGIAKSFSQRGIATWVGDIRENMYNCMIQIEKEVIKLQDGNIWTYKSRMMQELVDGKGAFRIAEVLVK